MPARELCEWVRYFIDQQRPPPPQSTEGMSSEALVHALGA